jgi:hypothetical protein
MNAIFLAVLLTSAAPSFEASALDGQTTVGTIDALTAERLTIAADKGPRSIPTAKLLTISRSPRVGPPPDAAAVIVELTDGSVMHGTQYVASGDKARVTLTGGEVVDVPTRIVRTVLCGNTDSQSLRSEWAQVAGMKTDADLLVVRSGDALDYHKGVLHDVTKESVRFDLDGEILPVKRSKVYGFVYRREPSAGLPSAVCRITDTSGSQWPVRSLALAATKLNWTTPAGLSVSQRLENVARIDFSSGKLLYLGDMQAESVAWTPFFAGRELLPTMKRFYAPRIDRGFDSLPLRLGKTEYRKGLAIQSRTELVYRLPERFSRFLAVAGIADAVRPGGKARLVIRGDDKVLFEAGFSGSAPPQPIDLDLSGVRRLTILVDFEAGLNVGSQLLLCNARVVK